MCVHSPRPFEARLWIDQDGVKVETWCYELNPTNNAASTGVAEWALMHLQDCYDREDFLKQFELDPNRCWQVIFKGTMDGKFDDYSGEYDEWFDILEAQSEEVSANWFKFDDNLSITENKGDK